MENVGRQRRFLTDQGQKRQVQRSCHRVCEMTALAAGAQTEPYVRTCLDQMLGNRAGSRQITDARPGEQNHRVNGGGQSRKDLMIGAREVDHNNIRRHTERKEHLPDYLGGQRHVP